MDSLLVTDPYGTIRMVNRATCDLLGYSEEQLVGKPIEAVVGAQEDVGLQQGILEKLLTEVPLSGCETYYRTKDSRRIPILLSACAMREEDGNVRYLVLTGIDATRSRECETALRDSESKYRTLVENLPQKVFLKDRNSVYVSCNENYARDLKIRAGEIAGRDDYEFHPKHLAQKYREDDQRVMKTGETEAMEERYVHDGQETWVSTVKTPVKNENGDVIGILGIFWDISEHKRLEAKVSAIHDFSRRISTLLEMDDILTVALDTVNEVLGFRYCAIHLVDSKKSGLYCRMHRGYSKQSMDTFRHPLDSARGITVRVAREGKPVIVPDVGKDETYLVGLKGAKSEMAAPLKVRNEILGVIDVESRRPNAFSEEDLMILVSLASYTAVAMKNSLLFRDLTDAKAELEEWNTQLEERVRERNRQLREAQDQLLRSERLATIGQLAASVGHEIRNPLGVLHNSLYLLGIMLKDANEKVKRQLDRMHTEVDRSNKIVSDLLEFSRPKDASLAQTDLNRTIEEALSKVDVPEGVQLITELGNVSTLIADRTQLESVFINLASNGIQAMPQGGTLTVKTGEENGFVEVSISDTGVGISRENLEKIFEPLFTTKPKGIGLGLCVTKRFVENHGGSIGIESTPNRGTTFIVRLPIEEGPK